MPQGKRAREVLDWSPAWDWPPTHEKDYSPRRWAEVFVRANKWRCDRINDHYDLMQEAFLVYMRIVEKYPRIITAKDFMKLYRASLANWFHDRSLDAARGRRGSLNVTQDDPTELLGCLCECPVNGINILLSEAPQEVRLALGLLAGQPELIRAGSPDERENLNMKLRRILGLSEKFDLRAALTELLFN